MHPHGDLATGTALDIAAWARHALASLARLPSVSRVGVALAEGGGRRLRFTASDRAEGPELDWCHVDAYDDVPLNTAVRSGTAVVGDLDDLDRHYSDFIERQRGTATVAIAAQPITSADQTLGGFVLYFDRPQSFDHRQRARLAELGAQLGGALRRALHVVEPAQLALPDEPTPPGASVASHEVTHSAAGVVAARHFLRDVLKRWHVDEEIAFTAMLCLSELVTNAVIHTHGSCVVRVVLDAGVLTTTVRDWGPRDPGAGEPGDDPLRVSGRGLQLVDALTSRWGSEQDAAGTTVWFVLEA